MSEIVCFQVRYHRYFVAITTEHPTLAEALRFAYLLFDTGEGHVDGIWEGEFQLHDDWSYIAAYEAMQDDDDD